MITKYLKKNKDSIIITDKDGYLDLLVSPDMIQSENGKEISLFLLGTILMINDEKSNNVTEGYVFKLGTVVTGIPSEKINNNGTYKSIPDDFVILRFTNGDTFIKNTKVIRHIDNVALLIQLIMGGKIRGLKYTDMYDIVMSNWKSNVELNVSSVLVELYIAEMFRMAKDIKKPVRLDSSGKYEYVNLSIRALVQSLDTFTATTFEDANTSYILATSKDDKSQESRYNPLEALYRM